MKPLQFLLFAFLPFIFSYGQVEEFKFEPSPEYPFGLFDPAFSKPGRDFHPLIGESSCLSLARIDKDNWADTTDMIWRWKYIMDGKGVQDETLHETGNHAGSIRQYIEDSVNWYVHYYSTKLPSTSLPAWEGTMKDSGDIVLYREQTAPNGMEGFYKIVFSDISYTSFNWIGAWVTPDESFSYPTWKIFCKKIPYVGYQKMLVERESKEYNPSGIKNIPIDLWYPSLVDHQEHEEEGTRYFDYIQGLSNTDSPQEDKKKFSTILNSFDTSVSSGNINQFYRSRAFSSPDAQPREGKFPLVLICGGRGLYHLELAEQISHQGFVVASFPRIGMEQGKGLPFNSEGAQEYIMDLEIVLQETNELPNVDPSRTYIICWSYEGAPALAYSAKSGNCSGFISLDASIGYEYGPQMIKDKYGPEGLKIEFPLIHYSGTGMDHGKSFDFLDQLKTKNPNVEILNSYELDHGGFTSISSMTIPKIKRQGHNQEYMKILDDLLFRLESWRVKD